VPYHTRSRALHASEYADATQSAARVAIEFPAGSTPPLKSVFRDSICGLELRTSPRRDIPQLGRTLSYNSIYPLASSSI